MTTLHLIRHGKASPGQANYDELHERGIEQARLLGTYLGARAARFDAVYCGPLVRQRDTLRLMRETAGARGHTWPTEAILDGLREAPVEMIMRQCMMERLDSDSALRTLMEQVQAAGNDRPAFRAAMGRVFDYMIELWRAGTLERAGLEAHTSFRARVVAALDEILARDGHATEIAVVTSNGVIGCMVEHVERVGTSAESGATARGELQFANSSITRVTREDGVLRVTARNVVEHLEDEKFVTYL